MLKIPKLIEFSRLHDWRHNRFGCKIVVTNGCFDVFHSGHCMCLTEARKLGDVLIVGINSDESVRKLKGPGRPINPQLHRAFVIGSLECVDAVCIFDDIRATGFLVNAEPHIYVKSGEWTVDNLDPEERDALKRCGARIEIIPPVLDLSSTKILGAL